MLYLCIGHATDIFPYFLRHAREMFPHLTCMDDLKKISDLRDPANWYPDARAIQRKVIFHAGPTNSGKVRLKNEKYIIRRFPLDLSCTSTIHE